MQATHNTKRLSMAAALGQVFADIGEVLQTADASKRRATDRRNPYRKAGGLKRKLVSGNKAVMPREPAARKNAARKASKVARKSRIKNKAK